jgi:hypothetical protein
LANDRVVRVWLEINILGVHDARLHVSEARFCRRVARQLEHADRNIRGQHAAGCSNALSGQDSLIARAGGYVEDPTASSNLG